MVVWLWVGFVMLILFLLALDLGVFHRKDHAFGVGEALAWTAFWVALALAFNVSVYHIYENHWLGVGLEVGHELSGWDAALQFFTGYVVEKSLSLDNIFVIALIFSYFGVPLQYQHRVLFWGILGALVLRGVMIGLGAVLIHRFDWVVYVFGVLLIVTAAKLLVARHDNLKPDSNPMVKLVRRYYPVTEDFHEAKFFVRDSGKTAVTPLFLALAAVESSDVVFAIDSIPAIFAITRDPFLVFTSNVFAILGLRSLYFALAALMERFRYLKMSMVFLLAYVGVKMLLSHHYPIPTPVSLAFIFGILSVGILASAIGAKRDTAKLVSPVSADLESLGAITFKQAKKVVVLIVGSTLIVFGVAMLVLPGPGALVLFGGLTVLATEFVWARRWLRRAKKQGVYVARFFRK
ncbi:MAG: TerC/Alx family metal homeostasis membrane protein [Candidatus Omnitrophica bacterium]|nr:TerC/Alx family metal homeostasis membrane protein [Candidatus Omnitrophota bacterium]